MTPGKYLFFIGLIYFVMGMTNIFVYPFTKSEYLEFAWFVALCMPFCIPVLSHWVGVKMFFRKSK